MIPSHIKLGFSVEQKGASRPLFDQVHGNKIIEISSPDQRDSFLQSPPKADGAITFLNDVEIYAFSADCLPLLFFTPDPKGPVAAVHSGWRGTAKGIAAKALEKMQAFEPSLHVVFGPCLLSCCFEIQQDFIDQFPSSMDFLTERHQKRYFDLPGYVREVSLGHLSNQNIHLQHLRCTRCSKPELPSYRRNKSTDPRIRAWIIKR